MSNPKQIKAYPISSLPKSWRESVRFMGCGRAKYAAIQWLKGYSGEGYYVYCNEYPEEGIVFLGKRKP